jgi:hypothetical protein
MKTSLTLSVAALCATALAAGALAASDPPPIQPGYWETVNRISAVVPLKKTVERKCVSPAEVTKFLSGPENSIYKCQYPTRVVEGGQLRFKGTCSSRKGRHVDIEASGTYTATSFTLTADIDTVYAGIPLGGRVKTEARRLAETCPPGTETKKK